MSIDLDRIPYIMGYMREWTGQNTSEFAIMSRREVRDFDAWAINQMKIPGVVLMENAARHCTQVILDNFMSECRKGICIFCGSGNNGGDGFVIARHLYNQQLPVKIVLCANPEKIKGDAKINYEICRNMNLPIDVIPPDGKHLYGEITESTRGYGLIVDALLGTGLQGELNEFMVQLITCINAGKLPIVAVDIPSGLDCDRGVPLPVCIEAAATVTFVAIKKGFSVCPASRSATGCVFVADIGITPAIC